jgi:hypothetical protein
MDKRRTCSCQTETEPAQGTRDPQLAADQDRGQDRDAEKERNKAAPVVKKGQKAEAVPDPVTAGVAAREPAIKIARIIKANIHQWPILTQFVRVRGEKEVSGGKNLNCRM